MVITPKASNKAGAHLLALNPQKSPNRGKAVTLTLDDYDQLTHAPWLERLTAEIRSGKEGLKAELPFRCAHYSAFRGERRKQVNILPEAFLYQTTIDVDDAELVEHAIQRARQLNEQPGKWNGKLLHLEYSARRKLHIDLRLPVGMTVEETQREYAEALGVPYDAACITPERFIYITPASEELYRSAHWYEQLDGEQLKMYREAFRKRGLAIDGRKGNGLTPTLSERRGRAENSQSLTPTLSEGRGRTENSEGSENSENSATAQKSAQKPENASLSPSPFGEGRGEASGAMPRRLLKIFDLCRRHAGLSHVDILTVGNRHTSLLAILSAGMAQLMTLDDALNVVSVKMPDYAQEKDCQQLIRDFYHNYTENGRQMTRSVMEINAEASREDAPEKAEQAEEAESLPKPASLLQKDTLPTGLKESLTGLPANMQMPVLCAVLPLAAAYADGVEVEYCDGRRQNLGLMSIIVGDQASGKSTCREVIDVWEKQMDEEDAIARKREDEWKQQRKTRKADERAMDDPHTLIRSVPVTISCSTLLRRFKNSRGHCLWSFGEELDTLRKTNGAGSWSSKYDIYRLAFDRGTWGQDYNSDQAESGVVTVAYNWAILGTYGALEKCFNHDNVENGLSSRVIIAEMPDNAFAKMPLYEHRSPEDDTLIEHAVSTLRSKQGFYETPKLRKMIAEWVEGKRIEAAKDVDYVKDTYRKRAAVIGFRAGVIAFLLSDEQETEEVLHFARMMANYVLEEQCYIFGEKLSSGMISATAEGVKRGKNNIIFDQLDSVFTQEDLIRLKGNEASDALISNIICIWKKNGWIEKVGKKQWKKKLRSDS
ncbi:MAG: hypothetical protein LKG25_04690 [Prevotella sp.]|jgi:hypothetical protein|nr:hypothetical protein [Prevotella sp.]MCI1281873.1 hypothetical protein [Prevotella sp.]